MTKTYIIGLEFGTWHSEVWFAGEATDEAQEKWEKAVKTLYSVGNECSNPNEFINAASEHFEKYGFTQIQR